MVPELCQAAKHPEIKNALINKISRERIGIEFEKMMTGPHPLLSIVLIHQLDLYSVIMASPVIKSGVVANDSVAVNAVGIVDWLLMHHYQVSSEEKRNLYISASVLPYYGAMSETKKKVLPAVQLVLRDSIKSNNTDVNTISTMYRGIELVKDLANRNTVAPVKRSELGMLIRDLGHLWQTTIRMTIVKEMLDTYALDWTQTQEVTIGKDILARYNALYQLAIEYNIEDCHAWKHIVDGKRAAQIVGMKPGPVVTELLKIQMIWQLDHPEGTKEECEQAIKLYWDTK